MDQLDLKNRTEPKTIDAKIDEKIDSLEKKMNDSLAKSEKQMNEKIDSLAHSLAKFEKQMGATLRLILSKIDKGELKSPVSTQESSSEIEWAKSATMKITLKEHGILPKKAEVQPPLEWDTNQLKTSVFNYEKTLANFCKEVD